MNEEKNKGGKLWMWALLGLFSLAGAFLIAETALRVLPVSKIGQKLGGYYFNQKGKIYSYGNKTINIRLAPHATGSVDTPEYNSLIFINSLGFRDYEFSESKAQDTYRILMVGDSVTFGSGVNAEQTFAKQIEAILIASPPVPGKRFEVFNLGCGSYSAGQNYVMIKELSRQLSPDMIILVHFANDAMEWPFYLGDDGLPANYVVTPKYWNSKRKPSAEKGVKDTAEAAIPAWLESLSAYSKTARLVAAAWKKKAQMREWEKFGTSEYFLGDPWMDPFWPLRKEVNLDKSEGWSLHERITIASRSAAVEAGSAFMVAFIPSGAQVNGYEWDSGRGQHAFAAGQTASYAMQEKLMEAVRKNNIPFLDLLPVYRKFSKEDRRIYYPYDGHLTPYGNAVTAEALNIALRSFFFDEGDKEQKTNLAEIALKSMNEPGNIHSNMEVVKKLKELETALASNLPVAEEGKSPPAASSAPVQGIAWMAGGVRYEGGKIIFKGQAEGQMLYAVKFNPENTTGEKTYHAKGVLNEGGISIGIQKDGKWVEQKVILIPGPFSAELKAGPGTYTAVIAHNIPAEKKLINDFVIESQGWSSQSGSAKTASATTPQSSLPQGYKGAVEHIWGKDTRIENGKIVFKGVAEGPSLYVAQLRPEKSAGKRVFRASGQMIRGGLSIGVQAEKKWVKQEIVTKPGGFEVKIEVGPGDYTPVISHFLQGDKLENDFSIDKWGWSDD